MNMLKIIIIAVILFLGYNQLTNNIAESKYDSVSASDDKIEQMKQIGKRVNKNTKAFKKDLNGYIYKFKAISSRKKHAALESQFNSAMKAHFRETYSYSFDSALTPKEDDFFEKLKAHMNKKMTEIDKLCYDVYVASAAAKTRAYNRECGKRAWGLPYKFTVSEYKQRTFIK